MRSRTIIFNSYPPPSDIRDQVHFYADDPVVQLNESNSFRRNKAQRETLVKQRLPELASSPFGRTVDWAYREYSVQRLFSQDAEAEPLGNAVSAPVNAVQRQDELLKASRVRRRSRSSDSYLYLFNVIVALEWIPDPVYLRQLEWAFRRASDLLYDVSNGTMAFGQVLFGDNEWMDCADIQITASNRTLPRSWVSGLHESEKYMPIRVGRGVWSRRAHRALAWDEPEAYRTLVHEWGHYALELRDEYLTKIAAVDCGADSAIEQMVVVPVQRAASESIMATPDGNSELGNPLALSDKYFPRLRMPPGYFPGPGRLPLPLPAFARLGALATPNAEEFIIQPPEQLPRDRSGVPIGEWAAFVLRRDANSTVQRIVAQGVLDGGSGAGGFRLLGARPHDRVVIIGTGGALNATVFFGDLPQDNGYVDWHSEPSLPMLAAIKPLGYPSKDEHRFVSITVSGRLRAEQAVVYPVGKGAQRAVKRNAVDVPTLDGHLLIETNGTPHVVPYSQGGSPATTVAVTTNPIPAGSSDGDMLLFFAADTDASKEQRRRYADQRVVTTTLYGLPDSLPNGARARSKVFGVASNARLDPELSPTAVLFFDPTVVPAGHELRVYKMSANGGEAQELPTCVPQGAGYAAVPLAASSKGNDAEYAGGTLLQDGDVAERVEYFQLFAQPV